MRKFLLLLVTILFVLKTKSQSYIPMLDSHSEWHVTNCFFGCLTDKYYTIGDTTFKGHSYKFLDLFHYMKNFVIREDTTLQRIYMRILNSPADTGEFLLYDFKLAVNDTMVLSNPGSPFPQNPGKFVLDSIKPKFLITKSHRHFYLHSLDTITSEVKNTIWVEGIGSLCLINTPGAPPKITGVGQLSCFFSSGIQQYQNIDSISSCLPVYPLSIGEKTDYKASLKILPNPTSNRLQIISNEFDFEGLKIKIINLLGGCVIEKEYSKFIDISTLSEGVYFINFYRGEKLYSAKFIKL